MGTKRTPIARSVKTMVSATAIETFRTMKRLEARCSCAPIDWGKYDKHEMCKSCERWWELNSILCRELHLKPWEFPAHQRPDWDSHFPKDSPAAANDKPDLEAQERYRVLKHAAEG